MKLLPITITGKTLSTTASPAVKGDKDIDALSIAVPINYEGTNLAQDAWHIRFKLPGGTVHTDPLTDGVPDDAEAPTILTFTYPMQGLIVSQSGNVALQIINVPADGSSIFQTLPGPSITVSGTLEGPPSADYNAAPWGTYLAQYKAIRDETKQYRDEAVDGAASALESASNAQESATQAAGSATDSHNSELAAKGYEEGAGLIKGAIDSLVASAPFQAVVGVADDIPTVAEVAEDIPAVAGAAPSIPTLAGVAEEVALLGPVATQIGQLSLIKDQIVSLEAERLKVVAVEAKLVEIQGVYAKLAEIEGVYGKSDEIDALYAQLDTIAAKANQADLDAVETRVDSTELTLARQGQDLASVKQTLQQGNGATLDFEDIGSVALDARATGRANPLVEGRTLTNLSLEPSAYIKSLNVELIDGIFHFLPTGDAYIGKGSIPFNTTDTFCIIADTSIIIGGLFLFARVPFSGFWKGTPSSADVSQPTLLDDYPNTTEAYVSNIRIINLTQSGLTALTETQLKAMIAYFDGTKSIQMPARVRSVSEDESESSTLYIADDSELRSVQFVNDSVSVINGEHILTKRISTPVSVLSGVAVNVTNYPLAKTGGKFAVELTAGGTQIGVIGTDSTSGAGMFRYELATPVITKLPTSGILQAKSKGTVYWDPYYEGAHQTNASSQITLPYEGTIDKLTGYDENLEPYEIPSTGYTLVGTTLTITGAEENEVYYVELSRSEPLAPEMTINTLNNEQVIADTTNGKYYKLVPTITNGALVSQTPVEVV